MYADSLAAALAPGMLLIDFFRPRPVCFIIFFYGTIAALQCTEWPVSPLACVYGEFLGKHAQIIVPKSPFVF